MIVVRSPDRPPRVLILGAAGRDFHVFNLRYRDDPSSRVVGFTAAQIPGIAGRRYPPSLAGSLYPEGLPIHREEELEETCRRERVTLVIFAYSDVTHGQVMHLASRALACGADFALLGPDETMIDAPVPVVAVSATRTGAGKSQIARWIGRRLRDAGLRVAILRHPMPYGALGGNRVQRFASTEDLERAACTIEEREEYEPHLAAGNVVFAGVDYTAIVAEASAEADVLVWDGGNNDFPFVRPTLHLVVVDALRPGHSTTHHPGEAVLRMADVVVVSKTDVARGRDVAQAVAEARSVNPRARILRAASPVTVDADAIRGRRVLVVEDGPTITHGGMPSGAGLAAATAAGCRIVDPRESAVSPILEVYGRHPHIGPVLPAVGYGPREIAALRRTIETSAAEVVVSATPIDLGGLLGLRKPVVRVRYEYADAGEPSLGAVIDELVASLSPPTGAGSQRGR